MIWQINMSNGGHFTSSLVCLKISRIIFFLRVTTKDGYSHNFHAIRQVSGGRWTGPRLDIIISPHLIWRIASSVLHLASSNRATGVKNLHLLVVCLFEHVNGDTVRVDMSGTHEFQVENLVVQTSLINLCVDLLQRAAKSDSAPPIR
jgi:hypothetical protein